MAAGILTPNSRQAACATLVCAVFFAVMMNVSPAHATDGVIEINHAKVMASGGYPYVISQPGSYRLTSNLTQTDQNTDVIQITANDVTLDLNGFAIYGPNSCAWQGTTTTCTANGTGAGVTSSKWLVTVKNGSLSGIGGSCINLTGPNSRVENVRVAQCGGSGINTQRMALVDRSQAHTCSGNGINAQDAINSVAERNGASGIYARTISHCSATQNAGTGLDGFSVTNSRSESNTGGGIGTNHAIANDVESNGGDGILIYDSGTVVGNSILGNGGFGINSNGNNVLFNQNVLDGNVKGSTGSWNVGDPLPKSLPANSNLCNGSPC